MPKKQSLNLHAGRLTVILATFFAGYGLHGQTSTAGSNNSPTITMSPAVIMVTAKPGQSFSQELTLWNNTINELEFQMQAEDVVVRNGRRMLVPAGELPGSIARYALFTDNDIRALPGSSVSTRVTVTVPNSPGPRAIACVFMGKTVMGAGTTLAMTASLGALVTFSISNDFKVESQPMEIAVDPDSKTINFRQRLKNSGSDPIIPKGVIAVTNESGVLVARLPVAGQRLLPGESLDFTAEHIGLLKAGKYKAMFLTEHESAFFSNAAEFSIQ